ncbi:MAG: rhomboid family intramembrane serine protease [Planctomycetes bacterium]|nr:rhomboid family intramembrane serine protease [Planctomycetota bacterium]
MRSIGRLPEESQGKRFGAFLHGEGVESQVDQSRQGDWEVWVLDDESVERAQALFREFVEHPDDPRFTKAARAVAEKRRQDQQEQVGQRNRMIDARTIFYTPPVPIGILTIILIVISIAITLLADFGKNNQYVQPFSITQYAARGYVPFGEPGLPEIRHGEIWRLFTPMFLHFGFLHIFFNMLWLRDLGSMIEARKSTGMLLVLVLVIAGASNLAQYLVSGPAFGGMSGVVYGLLGYIWMQGIVDPASKLSLEPQTVIFMIAWFFLCLFDLVGNVANTVHAVGLGVGIAWGFVAARLSIALRRG